jgi:hypothetical protein
MVKKKVAKKFQKVANAKSCKKLQKKIAKSCKKKIVFEVSETKFCIKNIENDGIP